MALTSEQEAFLTATAQAASRAGHIFPGMAAAEAALESAWGTSELARLANNLFGAKQQAHPLYPDLHLPTNEYIHGAWVRQDAVWAKYPNRDVCFLERMKTLLRLRTVFPSYDLALRAAMPEVYVQDVSRTWSTDPNRAGKCTAIYEAHKPLLLAALASVAPAAIEAV